MIAAGRGRWALQETLPVGGTVALRGARPLPVLPAPSESGLASVVAPLLARLLVGEPLDRDERAVIAGEVMRLWAMEAELAARPHAPRSGGALAPGDPRPAATAER